MKIVQAEESDIHWWVARSLWNAYEAMKDRWGTAENCFVLRIISKHLVVVRREFHTRKTRKAFPEISLCWKRHGVSYENSCCPPWEEDHRMAQPGTANQPDTDLKCKLTGFSFWKIIEARRSRWSTYGEVHVITKNLYCLRQTVGSPFSQRLWDEKNWSMDVDEILLMK
jgi:hypothetical protein